MCRALARGDDDGALEAMTTPPGVDSQRHVVMGFGDDVGMLMAHGQEWEVDLDGPIACPECGMQVG